MMWSEHSLSFPGRQFSAEPRLKKKVIFLVRGEKDEEGHVKDIFSFSELWEGKE